MTIKVGIRKLSLNEIFYQSRWVGNDLLCSSFLYRLKQGKRVKEKSPSHFIHEEYSRISTRVPMLKEWVKLLDGNNLLSLRGKIVPNPHVDRAHYVLTVTRY